MTVEPVGDVEAVARAIFMHYNFRSAVPWVPGGNSVMQDIARDYARAAIAAMGGEVGRFTAMIKGRHCKIDSLAELLRLINGGAQIETIALKGSTND